MRYFIFFVTFLFYTVGAQAQPGQITVNRIAQMPDMPAPYIMRSWNEVAVQYDQEVFSTTATGQYLPLISLKAAGTNYPELAPILLQTYVGTNSSNQAEAINIIPALVGASLVGIDKSNQSGYNWVEKAKDFYNRGNGQNVYLNGYSTTSGGDWWYDVMPNIFFYQLYTQYPSIKDFDTQFTSVADRWLDAVYAMGGSTTPWTVPDMNYRAWNLSTMTGKSDGVPEPEAAGGIGWLLYHAYLKTGEEKYLKGAQMSVEFLSNLTSNPSYELQLPYGAFIAAKMNAELGTTYDMPKLVNWCFDRGPLRGWGAITGTWNGADVDGLIGEANDGGNDYAFIMNGFQQAGALVPLVKYDKRFARDIAKWTLNLANASRLFYPQYLSPSSQDDFDWSSTNDPNSVIAYEALKEVWEGKPLYGTGDAKRNGWAQTNLGLYGSSHVGYLAAVIEPTDVEGILLLNANKTDFFKENDYPNYVIYNPYPVDKTVTLILPSGSYDIYDALSESIISTNVSGAAPVNIQADEAMLLVYIPAGSTLSPKEGKLYVGNTVIDYHYNYNFTGSLRIKSLDVLDTLVESNQQIPVYTTIENAGSAITYTWKVDGMITDILTTNDYTWTVPPTTGRTVLQLEVESDGKVARDSIVFNVMQNVPSPPVINAITTDKRWYSVGGVAVITCNASDDDNTPAELSYRWTITDGTIVSEDGPVLNWQTPATEGIYEVTCEVTDLDALTTIATKMVLVKKPAQGITPAFAYYPFDGNTDDYSGNQRDAQGTGVDAVADAKGDVGKAYLFNSGSDIIAVDNSAGLNFRDNITLSFWVKINSLSEESFIISHGSWEQRWKVSIIPGGELRWTVKTDTGTRDLDSSFPLTFNQFYHFTVVYSGYSMEIYADGVLDNFSAHSGLMGTTDNSLTMGRKDKEESNYYLRGVLDEVRIYNDILSPEEISTLMTTWNFVTAVQEVGESVKLFPNPSKGDFYITGIIPNTDNINIMDVNGRRINYTLNTSGALLHITLINPSSRFLILSIQTNTGIYHKKIILKSRD